MPTLTLYFNERCLVTLPHNEAELFANLDGFITAIEAVIKLRPDCQIGFIEGDWQADCHGQPLAQRIKQRLIHAKTRYQLLLKKIRSLPRDDMPLEHETYFQGDTALGFTLADLAAKEWGHGWAISVANGYWREPTIPAQRIILLENGDITEPQACQIDHLSNHLHAQSWHDDLLDWGAIVAQSSTLDMLGSHPIVMYSAPLEHNPPHVHLLESSTSRRTLAKFRIEDFVREKGEPNWDAAMKIWLETYRAQLLCSWERCQRGGHPYRLEKE